MKKVFNSIIALSTAASLASCSFMAPSTQTVSVVSVPAGAKISTNGIARGTSPVQIEAPRNKTLNILAEKPGYNPATVSVGRQLSGTGMADIVGGLFLGLPFLGLLDDGAWSLKDSNVTIPMSRR